MPITNLSPIPLAAPPVVAASQPVDPFTDLAAERWLLAAFLRDPQSLAEFRHPLFLPDFSRLEHRCILDACFTLRQASGGFTAQALISHLQDHDHCDALAVAQALLDQPPAAAAADAAFDRDGELANGAHRLAQLARHRQLLRWLETAPERLRRAGQATTLRGEAASLFNALHPAVAAPPMSGYHGAVRRFLDTDIKAADAMAPGLHRREVGELLADEAQGKTALLLQLGLALAAGEAQSPLLQTVAAPRRVVYVNGDAAASRLHDDIEKLVPQLENQEVALDNFRILFEAAFYGDPLTLYDQENWQRLATWIRQQEPDFVILDGVAALDPKQSKPSQRREQGAKLFSRLRELAKQTNCAILVAHSTITNGNRRRLGNAIFAAADSVYHFRSDHRYGDDYRHFRCVHSRWTAPPALGLQRHSEHGGYEVAPEAAAAGKAANPDLPTIAELVEYLGDGWQEKAAITQHFEGRASLYAVEQLIQEAHLYGWIWKQYRNLPWQLDKRGLAYIAAKKEREAEEAAAAKKSANTETTGELSANANASAAGNKNFRANTTDHKNFRANTDNQTAERVKEEPPLGSL